MGWNIFDFAIVVLVVLGMTSRPEGTLSSLQSARIFWVLRALRAPPTLRLFQNCRQVQTLANTLLKSLPILFRLIVIVLLFTFIYAIIVTGMIGKSVRDFDTDDQEDIIAWFGTIPRSMQILFAFLTRCDWSEKARTVNKVKPWMELVWVSYIIFVAFTLLSLGPGVMMAEINLVRTYQEEKMGAQQFDQKLLALKKILNEGDIDEDATIDCEEFQNWVCREVDDGDDLHKLGVPRMTRDEAVMIFDYLDLKLSGQLSWDEFSNGLFQLKHFSMNDLFWVEVLVYRLDRELGKIRHPGLMWDEKLNTVHVKALLVFERIGFLERDLHEFFRDVGYTPPP